MTTTVCASQTRLSLEVYQSILADRKADATAAREHARQNGGITFENRL